MVKSFIALVTCDFGVELQELLQRVVGGEALDPIVGYAVLGSTLGAFHLWVGRQSTKGFSRGGPSLLLVPRILIAIATFAF